MQVGSRTCPEHHCAVVCKGPDGADELVGLCPFFDHPVTMGAPHLLNAGPFVSSGLGVAAPAAQPEPRISGAAEFFAQAAEAAPLPEPGHPAWAQSWNGLPVSADETPATPPAAAADDDDAPTTPEA